MRWISGKDKCVILYDGINQSGTLENIPVGEFEHAKSTNANGRNVMILRHFFTLKILSHRNPYR